MASGSALSNVFWGVLVVCWSATGLAATQPYTLDRGFLAPQFFEEGVVGRDVGQVFGNPAGFNRPVRAQVACDASQDFMGYNRYAVSAVAPYEKLVFGFGIMQLSADDILEVPSAGSGRAVSVGTLSDRYNLLVATVRATPFPGFSAGLRVGEFRHKLADDEGKGQLLDAGFRQMVGSSAWVGIHARYLTPMHITWEKSGVKETVDSRWVYEVGMNPQPFVLSVSMDSDYYRGYLEWELHKRFSLMGDVVWDSGLSEQRMSVGTLIDFGGFALSYLHLHYNKTDLASDQDVVGLLFRLGGSK